MKAKTLRFGLLTVLAGSLIGSQTVRGAITGQWDFTNADLSATIGQPMQFYDAATQTGSEFGTTGAGDFTNVPDINGQPAKVLKFPMTTPVYGGFVVPTGAAPNGTNGFNLNQYTIIMDVLFPSASSGKSRALIQSDLSGTTDAQFFINAADGIGFLGGTFDGDVTPDTWHRLAFAVDASASPPVVSKFIDGVKVGEDTLPQGLDGIYSLQPDFLLFNDDQTNATQTGYISSLQIRDQKLSDGLIAALGGPSASGILTGPPPNPYITSVSPDASTALFPGRSKVSPNPAIVVTIEDGQSAVVTNTIQLTLDDQTVVPSITKQGTTTTVSYTTPNFLAPLSIHTVTLTYQDDATPADHLGTKWQFAVGDYVSLPLTAVQAEGSANTRGFVVRTVQAPANAFVQNNYLRAIQQLDGTLANTNGVLFTNEAVPGPNPDGSYDIDDVIDFELTGTPLNAFPAGNTTFFPGIPGLDGVNTMNFATEVTAFLDLTAGPHTFGVDVAIDRVDVQPGGDDDGYRLYVGANARDLFSTLVGQFVRTGDNFNDRQNTNDFTFIAPTNGIYPFRLVYWQNGHGANLAWYSVDPSTGDKILINDSSDPRAVKAYRVSTAAAANGPYVAEVSPTPGVVGIASSEPVNILLGNGQTTVDTNTIQLTFNGSPVTPEVTPSGNFIQVNYRPDPARTTITNTLDLVYADTAGNRFTNDWEFAIAPSGSGNANPVTGQWDFNNGDLSATVGQDLEYFDGTNGVTASKTRFGTTTDFGIPDIDGEPAHVMEVPGDINNKIGYIMHHGISPNGGGTRVNQYTLTMDLFIAGTGGSAASLIQINSLDNTDDGDLFWENSNLGQGGGGYGGLGTATPGAWHRITLAVDLAANPPVITKFVDGIKQEDWVQQGLDQDRRALKPYSILFADGDGDDRRLLYVSSIQIREGKVPDAEIVAMGGPTAAGIPTNLPPTDVTGQWDFNQKDLSATVGQPLQYFDGTNGVTASKTLFGSTTNFGIPDIDGEPANVMEVPGDINNQIGYIMHHGIAPNGGGTRVNQYTLTMDLFIAGTGGSAASLIQINSLDNTDDGDLFWENSNLGQGGGGYGGLGTATPGAWHRISLAVDLAANPPVITKFVDGIKQEDWVQQGLDQDRRALKPYSILFADGDGDDRRLLYVSSIQIRSRKLSDAEMVELGGPSASGIPVAIPRSNVTGQWDFDRKDLSATVGQPLQYFDGTNGVTMSKTQFGTTTDFGIPDINGQPADVMEVPGDINNQIGYIMNHGIAPNGGGTRVNQYTLTMDLFIAGTGGSAASLIQINSLDNTDDGDLFWENSNLGQGTGGYGGLGTATPGAWHRISLAVDLAANPPVITKFVDGIKQEDWVQQGLDQDRRALKPTAILFADGDGDDRRLLYVNSIQIRSGKLSDAELTALGGPSASGIPVAIPSQTAVVEQVTLTVIRSGDNLTISWPASLTGYTLEGTDNLLTGTWSPVSGVVNNAVTVTAGSAAQFYRLSKP